MGGQIFSSKGVRISLAERGQKFISEGVKFSLTNARNDQESGNE